MFVAGWFVTTAGEGVNTVIVAWLDLSPISPGDS
jgi:hypothetical protein